MAPFKQPCFQSPGLFIQPDRLRYAARIKSQPTGLLLDGTGRARSLCLVVAGHVRAEFFGGRQYAGIETWPAGIPATGSIYAGTLPKPYTLTVACTNSRRPATAEAAGRPK